MDKIINLGGAVVFGVLGMSALIGAMFFEATHQYAIAAIAAVMTWASIAEYIAEKKKEEELQ